jgi:hypothetical protein
MAAWIAYALLAAVFAALVAILGKVGVKNIDATLATAVRAGSSVGCPRSTGARFCSSSSPALPAQPPGSSTSLPSNMAPPPASPRSTG